ncbi:MAG: flavodoxin family protein [Methanobacterium sp.]|uniref:flavodoxin family protein n=1 Tax=Methanobacterium sp. TaxID=2164 RepID=UPI003C7104C8
MKVLAINGSPRKQWNTATLLNKALEGAYSEGAETELINLYDLNFVGCTSCFACKLKNGVSYGHCAFKDELSPVLKSIEDVDALILGSPIYLGTVTGVIRSFLERLIFPYLVYDTNRTSLFPKKLPVGFIYTMGANEEFIKTLSIDKHIELNEMLLDRMFGLSESLIVTDTYQFDDYSKYVNSFDVEEKTKRRIEIFPIDCEKAHNMGMRFAKMV